MKREWQIKAALGPYLLHMWRHRNYTMYVLALVKDTDMDWVADLEFVKYYFSEFMVAADGCLWPLVVALVDPTKTKGFPHERREEYIAAGCVSRIARRGGLQRRR